MAQLAPATQPGTYTGARLGYAQFRAIAWLRWRIYANGFRRKGGKGELIARIFLIPLATLISLVPTAVAGGAAWAVVSQGAFQYLSLVFWAAFALAQLVNLNLGQPGTTFDPTELIRFPLTLRNYIVVRLGFGLLSPANVLVVLMSLAIFAGVTIAQPGLWLGALVATAAFALASVLFSRMIFAWIDRWLSTRRARELFTGLIFAASLGFQYLNVNYNPGFNHHRANRFTPEKLHHAQLLYARFHALLRWLPPELAANSIIASGLRHALASLAQAALILAYAALFLLIYALRMRTEYQGENLSDAANAVRPAPRRASTIAATPSLTPIAKAPTRTLIPPAIGPLVTKEVLTLRRNIGLLYGVIAPTVMVFLFAGRLSLRGGSHWLLLIAVGYALLGLAPMSYNSFGLEGPGAQFYFMAPVPLREVFFSKNLIQFLLALFEVLVVIAIITYLTGRPALADVLFVLLWAAATLLLNTTFGNLRSITAPKKVNPGRTINRTQSQVSAWIAIGLLAGSAAIGFGLQTLSTFLHLPWLALASIALIAAGALVVYHQGLQGIDAYALNHRDTLFEELGKKT